MGYTRYYEIYNKLDKDKFKQFSEKCKLACDEITNQWGEGIAGRDGQGEPEFLDSGIRFNGIGKDSCETFAITPTATGFHFTKTNRCPYDRHVLACLLLAKEYFADSIRVSSDGDNDDQEIKSFLKEYFRDKKINILLDN